MKRFLLLIIAVFTGLNAGYTQMTSPQDSLALVALYNSTNGDNWSNSDNWLNGPVHTWYGVTVDTSSSDTARVTSIDLDENNLSGEIPPEIGNLINLSNLILEGNQLTGSLPTEIGNLKNSSNLLININNNQLDSLPDLSSLTNLDRCFIEGNHFDFSDLKNAGIAWDSLFDYSSQYSYSPQLKLPKPDTVSNGDQLTFMVPDTTNQNQYIWYKEGNVVDTTSTNSITVTDSASAVYHCTITNDQYPDLTLETEQIHTGSPTLSHGVSEKDYAALVALYDSTNGEDWNNKTNWLSDENVSQWNGIAVENSRVTQINLNQNNLSGAIPSDIGDLSNLNTLDLAQNNISGNIPVEIGNLTNLNSIYLDGNDLTGPIPTEIGNLTSLTTLDIARNQLSGSIPQSIGSMNTLNYLNLNKNELKGSVPPELNSLNNLTEMNIAYNHLDSLPDLSGLTNLEGCFIDSNRFNFSDLQRSGIDTDTVTQFRYYRQEQIPEPDTTATGDQLTLTISDTAAGNQYVWYKDKNALDTTSTNSLTIKDSIPASYYCTITNDQYPDLTLESEAVYTGTLNYGVSNEEYQALVALYDSTNGENWTKNDGWLSDSSVGNWIGVTVEHHMVTEIFLKYNNLSGSIPSEIGNLNNLKYLSLLDNQLSGSIPTEMGNLTSLKYLILAKNELTGSIPPEVLNLNNLESLSLSANPLSGTLPPEIGYLSHLNYLSLAMTQLSGSIPSEMGNLANLEFLYMYDNQFDNLPDLSTLDSLDRCRIHENRFDFADLQRAGIEWGTLSDSSYAPQKKLPKPDTIPNGNQLTLSVSDSTANNTYVWYKQGNPFDTTSTKSITVTDSVPATYYCKITNDQYPKLTLETREVYTGNMTLSHGVSKQDYQALVAFYDSTNGENWNNNTNWKTDTTVNAWYGVDVENYRVTRLDLPENSLSGSLPDEVYDLTSLEFFNVANNNLEGSISHEIENLDQLKFLGLAHNRLTGNIPDDIYKLDKLYHLSLVDNALVDKIPPQIGNLNNLVYLHLGGNSISGEIPPETGNLSKLERLYLPHNQISGSIPSELQNLESLKHLVLFGNELTDSIPPSLGNLSNLVEINFGRNQLSGPIPAELGNLKNLSSLNLSGNQLSGEIPQELSTLSNLNHLLLNYNQLTGTIPPELGNLQEVKVLNLSNNNLSGAVPDNLNNLANCYDLSLKNNSLDSIPALTGMPLSKLQVQKNLFDFQDLVNTGYVDGDSIDFIYAPQGQIPVMVDTLDTTIALTVTEQTPNATYQWFKNSRALSGETDSILSYPLNDTSVFYCEVTQPDYPELQLQTVAVGQNIKQGVAEKDYKALKAIYEKTGGNNWASNDNWLSDKMVSTWFGIRVKGYRVSVLYLSHNNLSGNVPIETFQLDSLTYLSYWDNQLTGEIPDQFDKLPKLELLSFTNNQIEGDMPDFSMLNRLNRLYLDKNNLDNGQYMGNLPKLENFYIRSNQLTFEDLNDIGADPDSITNYGYGSQAIFPLKQNIYHPNQGDTLSLNIDSISVDTLGGTSYEWRKDGNTVSSSAELMISSFSESDTGRYVCYVTNASYPELTLSSDSLTLRMNASPDGIALSDSTIAENNAADTTVGQLSASDANRVDSHSYSLVSGDGNNDADNDKFQINGDTLKATTIFNYENQSECNIYVQATDKAGSSVKKAFTIAVKDQNDAPAFTSDPFTHAKEDSLYSYLVTTREEDGDTVVFQTSGLPDWLTLKTSGSGSATLSGTPKNEDVGSHTVTLKITDNMISEPVEQQFTIDVENVNSAPQYTTEPINQAKENTKKDGYQYQYQIKAIDQDKDKLQYSAVNLPDWLSLTDNGDGTADLTGYPQSEDVGDHDVTVGVTDGVISEPVDQSFTLTVLDADVNGMPEFRYVPDTVAYEDSMYTCNMEIYDIEGDSAIFNTKKIPGWLSFTVENKNQATLSGTPHNEDVGNDTVQITASDKYNEKKVTREFILEVVNVNDAPRFTKDPVTEVREDSLYRYAVAAKDIDGDELSLTCKKKPGWLKLDHGGEQPVLTGTPGNKDLGSHQVIINLTDNRISNPVQQNFTITVENTNDAPVFTSEPVKQASEDSLFTYQVAGKDVDGDSLSIHAKGLPIWLDMKEKQGDTALLKGTPSVNAVGDHPITLELNDGHISEPVEQNFTLTVSATNDRPEFTSLPITQAKVNKPYSYKLKAIDEEGDSIHYGFTSVPDWLNLEDNKDSTALLSGTPATTDTAIVGITITDSIASEPVKQLFTLEILPEGRNCVPSIITSPVGSADEDESYSYQIEAYDADGDSLIYSAAKLPDWLSLTDNKDGTALLEGTPENADVGLDTVAITVKDTNKAVTEQSFTLRINNNNDVPTVISGLAENATEDETFTSSVETKDIDGDDIAFYPEKLPEWLTIKSETASAELSGTPKNADVGKNPVWISMKDNYMDSTITIKDTITVANVNDQPVFVSEPVTQGSEDAKYEYSISANDPDGDQLTIGAAELPGWMSLTDNEDGTATLSGTPKNADVGSNEVTLTLDDGHIDAPVKQHFTVDVANVNDAPRFTSTPLTEATEDETYSYTVETKDIDGDAVAVDSVKMPTWLEFTDNEDGTAVIKGIPGNSAVGKDSVIVAISDGNINDPVMQKFEITVANVNDVPEFTSAPLTQATEDTLYEYTVTAKDVDGDPLTIMAPELPDWLSFVDNGDGTATLSGTPENDNVGSHEIVLELNDGNIDAPVEQTFTLEVTNVNDKPRFTSEPVTQATASEAYKYNIKAHDVDGDSLTFDATQLPSWLTLEAKGDSSASLSGTPGDEQVGDNPVTITITDRVIETPVKQEFTITVEEATGISDPALKEQITLYPNPSSGKVTVDGVREGSRITITSMEGNTIMEKEIQRVPVTIDLRGESNGVYFLRYIEGNRTATFRIILE